MTVTTLLMELPTVTWGRSCNSQQLGIENQIVKRSNPNSNIHEPCEHGTVIRPSESPSSYLQKQSGKYRPPSGAVKTEWRDGCSD